MGTPSKSGWPEALVEPHTPLQVAVPKMSRWRRMQIPVVAWIAYGAVRIIGPTLRVEIVGVHHAAQLRDAGEPAIGAFWHRCIFPAVWIWRRRGIVVLNTVNFDGQWTRRVIERLGFGTAQGSSTRGAMEGLQGLAKNLEKGRHVALTIDGPRGPRYQAKPGAVILARRSGRPISVFHIGVKWGHTFRKSWDQFRIPYPCSPVVMFVAPPIRVPADAGSEIMKAKQAEVQAALERVRDTAERWFDQTEEERDAIREEWRQHPIAEQIVAP